MAVVVAVILAVAILIEHGWGKWLSWAITWLILAPLTVAYGLLFGLMAIVAILVLLISWPTIFVYLSIHQ